MLNLRKTFGSLAAVALGVALLPASKAAAQGEYAWDFFEEDLFGSAEAEMMDFGALEFVGTIERVGLIPGRDLNGRELNRPLIDGAQLESVSVFGARHPSAELFEVYLDGSAVLGVSDQGHLSAVEMGDTVFDATLEDGTAAAVRIDSFSMTGLMGSYDVTLYEVSYVTRDMEDFEPLCGLDETGYPIQAIALAGTWDLGEGVRGGGDWIEDPASFTLACRRYALAKCVEAGYGPWATPDMIVGGSVISVPLRPYHQACTRMMRADYCGNGTSYTVDGTLVNFYDDVGIRMDSEAWDFEAEWDGDGALCASTARITRALPACAADLVVAGCGTFAGGTLLLSEVDR